MGLPGHLIGPAPGNPKGHFEDECFHNITGGMLGSKDLNIITKEWLNVYTRLVESHKRYPIWGLKDPAFCTIWPKVEHLFGNNVQIVAVHRQFQGVVNSRRHAQGMSRDYAERFHNWSLIHMHNTLHKTRHPVHHVQYEDLLSDTENAARSMLQACLQGTEIHPDIQSAIDFIDPSLRNF